MISPSPLHTHTHTPHSHPLFTEKKLCGCVERELVTAAREVCESQETCTSLAEDCASLEEEIERLVDDKYKAELKLAQVAMRTQQLQEVAEKYREKMSTHTAKTKEMESSLPAYKELEELKTRAEALRRRSKCLHIHTPHIPTYAIGYLKSSNVYTVYVIVV